MKTHLDLFSGIGGFALAASWAGYQTVGFCEIEDYPRRILSKRFPGVPCHRDIWELDGSIYRGVDLITGGYPCQPFSQAGQRKGKEDDRHLWPELRRVIAQARPAFLVAENVAGHITLGLDEVLADLESEGYAGRAIVVPACAKNAPHRRDRVWIIAKSLAHSRYSESSGRFHQEECGKERQDARDKTRDESTPRSSSGTGGVAHSDGTRLQGFTESNISGGEGQKQTAGNGLPTNTNPGKFVGRLGGSLDGIPEGLDFPRRWGDGSWEDGIPRVTVGAKNRTQRLKALGNAIVPQVAYEIIKELERNG